MIARICRDLHDDQTYHIYVLRDGEPGCLLTLFIDDLGDLFGAEAKAEVIRLVGHRPRPVDLGMTVLFGNGKDRPYRRARCINSG